MARVVGDEGAWSDVLIAPNLNAHGGYIGAWTARFGRFAGDVTEFGDTNQVIREGLIILTGTASGSPDSIATPVTEPASRPGSTMTLGVVGVTAQIAFVAAMTSVNVGMVKGGDATVEFEFESGEGAITETWP